MENFPSNSSRKPVRVTIFASLKLISDYLRVLLEKDPSLQVIGVAETHSELLDVTSRTPPDVVLMCLMDDEGGQISLISDLITSIPGVRVVLLSSPNSNLDQPKSLKLGVRGIVGTNQNTRVLTRAIQQVSDGEVWLNQKLMDQLLRGGPETGNGKSTNHRSSRVHELTGREVEIIELVGFGLNNKDISKKLSISEATVRHHLSSIYSKLHVEDRLNLAIFAYQQGIVKPPA